MQHERNQELWLESSSNIYSWNFPLKFSLHLHECFPASNNPEFQNVKSGMNEVSWANTCGNFLAPCKSFLFTFPLYSPRAGGNFSPDLEWNRHWSPLQDFSSFQSSFSSCYFLVALEIESNFHGNTFEFCFFFILMVSIAESKRF